MTIPRFREPRKPTSSWRPAEGSANPSPNSPERSPASPSRLASRWRFCDSGKIELVFSSRFHWDLQPNPLTKLLHAKREAGTQVLDLTESNPTSAGIHYPAAEILSSLADPRSLRYEPTAAGLPAAREAVAGDYYRGKVD